MINIVGISVKIFAVVVSDMASVEVFVWVVLLSADNMLVGYEGIFSLVVKLVAIVSLPLIVTLFGWVVISWHKEKS
jgi:hypothetical protein